MSLPQPHAVVWLPRRRREKSLHGGDAKPKEQLQAAEIGLNQFAYQ
jgi:hypothetical protein